MKVLIKVEGSVYRLRSLEQLNVDEKRRLVHEVLDKKNGVNDKDWNEIIDEFGLDMHVDTLRRASIGVKLFDEISGNTSDNGFIDRQKIRDLTSKLNEQYRSQSRSELLRETVAEAVAKIKPMDIPVVKLEPQKRKTLVVALGDFHYGADISVKGLCGETINVYNQDVFVRRMSRLLAEIKMIAEKDEITDIEVMLVGDLIDGILRQSQLMRLEFGLVDQVIGLSELLAEWINKLSFDYCVNVHAVTGNHSEIRPLRSKAREFEDENLEKLIMWFVKERLKDNWNIKIDDECSRLKMVDVRGFNFVMIHGDGENSISQIAQNVVNLYQKKADYFVCGHLHKEQELPSGYTSDGNSVIVRVPSLCGMDRYAQSKGYGGHAGATVMVIEAGYGRRCVYPIKLD